ncbi:recombinase family protein [Amycolatopsis alkalitolerans]|uniref:recombinase family protein n=1 Tax=Amycolatopsis alkalitolerans TaxID=2547244 RepID=UPI00135ACF4F|nr:recombinase family protein [Amycolatopsis alkalitolerans]
MTYLRFSHVDLGGNIIAAARELCERRANELGARVVAEYIDIGPDLSDDRDQLGLMLDDIAPGEEIDYVIVPDHSTIAKDMHVYTRVAWRIQQAKAKLVAASSPLDQYQAMCAHPLGLMQAVADWANEDPRGESHPKVEGEGGTL